MKIGWLKVIIWGGVIIISVELLHIGKSSSPISNRDEKPCCNPYDVTGDGNYRWGNEDSCSIHLDSNGFGIQQKSSKSEEFLKK